MSRIATRVYTLRSASRHLLPQTSVLLYGNSGDALRRALHGVAAYLHERFEVLLLHDGPLPQGNFELGRRWHRRTPLTLIATDRPCGPAHCANAALEQVQGEQVLLLQAGDLLDPDGLAQLSDRLQRAPATTVGVYGDLQGWEGTAQNQRYVRTYTGEPKAGRRHLFARLKQQTHLAPPLVRAQALQQIGGYPTDYPGQGWQLGDTALALALLATGTLTYQPDLTIRRLLPPRPAAQRFDERKLLNVLLRQHAKRLQVPAP